MMLPPTTAVPQFSLAVRNRRDAFVTTSAPSATPGRASRNSLRWLATAARSPWLGWIALSAVWALAEMMIDERLIGERTTVDVLLSTCLLAICLLLADPVRRFAGVIWIFLLAYFGAAFVARHGFDLAYFPFVSDEAFDHVAIAATRAFCLSYIVFFPLLQADWCRSCIAAHTRALDRIAATPANRIYAICLALLALGAADWIAIAKIGIGIIGESGRRSFADSLTLSSDHNAQLIAIPVTIVATIYGWRSRDRLLRALVAFSVSFAWAPSILVGARKEFFIICIAFLSMWLGRPLRPFVCWAIISLAVIFIAIPILFDGDIAMGFHEFILPFYNVVSMHEYSGYLESTSSFFSGAQFLLPSFLRSSDAHVFGTDLADLMAALGQNVSYGGQPYAEVMSVSDKYPALTLLLSNGVLFGSCFALARCSPLFTVIAFPFLALWGRSVLWVTLFFVLYGGLIMILIVGPARRHLGLGAQPR